MKLAAEPKLTKRNAAAIAKYAIQVGLAPEAYFSTITLSPENSKTVAKLAALSVGNA